MSLDKNDFARSIQRRQFGLDPGFFPIVISPATGGPGGTQMVVGTSYAININPCDHVWLPTFYDASIGLNPAQYNGSSNGRIPFQGPNASGWNFGTAPIGMNVFDVNDASQYGGGAVTNVPVQTAAVFALQFNSPNAPWLLWTLSDLLAVDTYAFGSASAGGCGCFVGSSDAMRSITGPISSMNFKLLIAAYINGYADLGASQIVLLSSLGYRQQSVGVKQSQYSTAPINATATDAGVFPQAQGGPSPTSFGGGGYVQTNLNSLEIEEQERRGKAPGGSLR